MSAGNLVCPIDRQPLEKQEGTLRCSEGHSYDIARQGYVNLLLVQQKKSRSPGDSREMVEARRAFLDTGRYRPIADKLSKIVLDAVAQKRSISLLDAGCGEGYYTDSLLKRLLSGWPGSAVSMIGVDISRPAVLAATRRNRDTCWIVGTNRNLPVADNSVDIILSLFGYPQFEHFHALLKPGGVLVMADAGARHLLELRELLYEEVRPSREPSIEEAIAAGFQAGLAESLRFEMRAIGQDDLMHLARMTPHYYRAPRKRRAKLENTGPLTCSVDVLFRTLVKS